MQKWGKLNYAQKRCVSLAGKLMQNTGQLHPGARVGVAVSGGVDSFVMLQVLRIRQAIVPFPFELMALHVNPGFDPHNHNPLVEWTKERGIATHIELSNMGPEAHSEVNRKKSPCFYCSWFRRKRLFDLCKKYKLTHLALGHNSDDLVSNFFMNMFNTGRVAGMGSCNSYFNGELHLIRPLLLVEKKFISKAGRAWDLPIWKNPCPSSGSTKRSEIHEWLDSQCESDKGLRKNIFNAITRWQLDLDRIIS